jgi:hypothetical protein
MNREFTVIIERDARDFYVASVPTLRGCHSQADALDERRRRSDRINTGCESRRSLSSVSRAAGRDLQPVGSVLEIFSQ